MAAEHELGVGSGLSRRQLLARGAIAGGLVWAAPVIRTTAAYATTANGTELPCTDFFMVVIGPSGQVRAAPGNINAGEVPKAIRQWFADNPGVTVQFPAVKPQLTQRSESIWAVLLPEVTGPNAGGRQCRMVIGWDRKGSHRAEGYVDPNPPLASQAGRRLLFPCPDRGRDGTSGNVVGATVNASAAGGGQVGSDGTASPGIGSDGSASTSVSSDGSPSKPGGESHGDCIEAIYLIYCCPR